VTTPKLVGLSRLEKGQSPNMETFGLSQRGYVGMGVVVVMQALLYVLPVQFYHSTNPSHFQEILTSKAD
jgi:hypothetical protein